MFVALLSSLAAVAVQPAVPPIVTVPVPAPPPPPAPPIVSPSADPAFAKPRTSTMMLFSTDDYPLAAIARGEEGPVRAEVIISPEGRVSECRIVESSRSAALDVTTCNILRRRARYSPARDSVGRPVEDRQTVKIRWQLEGGSGPAPFTSWIYRTIVRLDERHEPVACRFEYGAHGADLVNCEMNFARAREILGARPGLPPGKPASLVFEYRFEAGPAAPAAVPIADPHRQFLSTLVAEFDVAASGRLENCRTVLRRGGSNRDLCESPFNRQFTPADNPNAAPRTGRISTSVYAMW